MAAGRTPIVRRVPVAGGGSITIRPTGPADVDGLVALYDGLSDDDRYRRFFSAFRPPRAFFERLTSVAARGGYGLVATLDPAVEPRPGVDGTPDPGPAEGEPAGRLVAEASYELLPNGDGELGMAVAADQRGWLGPFLLDALLEAAAARGVPDLEADVLASNTRMLALLRARGDATMAPGDWTVVRLIVGTRGRTPVWPDGCAGGARRGRVLVESPSGRWAEADGAADEGLDVIACRGPRGARPRCPALAGRPCPLAAGADAIVVRPAPGDDRWESLVDAHATLHPGVPVFVEPRGGGTAGAGRPAEPSRPDVRVVTGDEVVPAVAAAARRRGGHRRASGET